MDILSAQVTIYPNPTKGKAQINLPLNEQFYLTIFDIRGRTIIEKEKISHKYIINNYQLLSGNYIVKLEHREGVINRKLIIE